MEEEFLFYLEVQQEKNSKLDKHFQEEQVVHDSSNRAGELYESSNMEGQILTKKIFSSLFWYFLECHEKHAITEGFIFKRQILDIEDIRILKDKVN